MKDKKYYLVPKIISIFFMLFLFSIKAQAVSNISINLKTPTDQNIINSSELNIDGEIKSILKLKSVYLYIDNENIGQANLDELEFKENTYKARLKYTKNISSLKNGIHNLRILAIDEQNNKEEKEISINIKRDQEKLETNKNTIQNNFVDTTVKMGSIEKSLTTVSNEAKLEKVEVSYNGNVVTNGEMGVGKSYVIKGYGNSANGVLYQFWVKDLSTNSWTMIRDYGETNSFNYTPAKAGKYLIGIHVKDKYSKENLDDFIYENYTVTISKAKLEKVEVSYNGNVITNGEIGVGKSYVIKGYGNSANGVLYQFWVKDLSTNSWTMIKDYGEENSINWKPTVGGKYLVGIHVKDKYSIDTLDDHIYENYTILSDNARLEKVEVKLDGNLISNNLNVGKTYTIEGSATSKNGVLYQFWVKDLSINSWAMLRDYGESNNITYTPTKSGQYLIGVHVKDKNSKESLDDFKYNQYSIIGYNKTVIVDAGHGGYDSGAVGPTGIKEKDVTLKVALKLGKILENSGVNVIYTRTSDNVSWPSNESQDLAARVAIANNNNTDLYVSIHANSFNGSANGTETYYYDGSAKGKETAEKVQKELVNSIGLYDRGVKTAGYYVLKNTISPSILVELGFIDNRNEEILLNSDWFQQKCAEAIAKGILSTSFM
ncbi:N-acetylmuramoyl-L-alanine amidase [Clostridium botulinum]|nr:N-acetylmuramoyl-L-alanine amidase [Clostridium botulinum]NFE08990.1 N-acetylmuramoyl-L-alanine amidase [Clostridium botulinum]NFE48182.1 N-acetylmuramoyl-L-alanine amidase [Clostridium botulinum]NFE55969.1 N-acetylmuramoyl-L-alanine amidase [Clostridium botulinum]NFH24606.1 N-acetylmuramoyl-L-alanine amidase [Clostridium botulinum]